ncbi:hypothetical protein ElyMa_002575300 [Elysia marginata]|uniref:Uncharacterized protein n=1 Tax=Elysia marginata TaxID=1093978 RepID=A0AAV4GZX9_9GAST|nr:hypothetical protein ElyMa_002575300 [Elysia marginata]
MAEKPTAQYRSDAHEQFDTEQNRCRMFTLKENQDKTCGLKIKISTLACVFRSKSLLSTIRPKRYPGSSSPRDYCLPLTNTLPWAFRSKSLLSTIRPTHYPACSGPRAYFLPLDQHTTLGVPVQELLSTARPARYPGLSGPRAFCLSLDWHATLGLQVQEPTVYPYTSMLPWAFRFKSLPSTGRLAHSLGLSG